MAKWRQNAEYWVTARIRAELYANAIFNNLAGLPFNFQTQYMYLSVMTFVIIQFVISFMNWTRDTERNPAAGRETIKNCVKSR